MNWSLAIKLKCINWNLFNSSFNSSAILLVSSRMFFNAAVNVSTTLASFRESEISIEKRASCWVGAKVQLSSHTLNQCCTNVSFYSTSEYEMWPRRDGEKREREKLKVHNNQILKVPNDEYSNSRELRIFIKLSRARVKSWIQATATLRHLFAAREKTW